MTTASRGPAVSRPGFRSGRVLGGLALLASLPVISGTLRLVQLAGGPQLMPVDPRFAASAVPLVAHVVGSLLFALVGAVQFVPELRRRGHTWHRRAGRAVAVFGVVAAGSALWITLFASRRPGTGDLLFALRLAFASAMVACLALGFAAIRRGDVTMHRAWMVRAYAIGMAAGTQALTEGVSRALLGSTVLLDDTAKGMGWILNLAVAEWVIRRSGRRHRAVPATSARR